VNLSTAFKGSTSKRAQRVRVIFLILGSAWYLLQTRCLVKNVESAGKTISEVSGEKLIRRLNMCHGERKVPCLTNLYTSYCNQDNFKHIHHQYSKLHQIGDEDS
jgi:hypothetical protein